MNIKKQVIVCASALWIGLASSASHAAFDPSVCAQFEKSADVLTVPLGGTITYTFTVTNSPANPEANPECGFAEFQDIHLMNISDDTLGTDIFTGNHQLVKGDRFTTSIEHVASECGPLTNTATAKWVNGNQVINKTDSATVTVLCETNAGAGTPGYWKNHPDAWPVESITIGGNTYTKEAAIRMIDSPIRGDKTITLFKALVATKLNLLMGTNSSCIADITAMADAWMKENPYGSWVPGSDDRWKVGEPLYWSLDDYNNGKLCAPRRW